MDTSSFTHRWIRKFRFLVMSLIFSGALNIGLIAAFVVVLLQDHNPTFSYSPHRVAEKGEEAATNGKLLAAYAGLSFRQLAALLTNTECVEEGYRKRDLALSALVSFHHFNLEKALGGQPVQRRTLMLDSRPLEIFPGLTDDQFKAVSEFAYLEKWPLTGEGLLALAKKSPKPRDPTLDQAFALTSECYALQRLFQKCEPAIDLALLIDLVSEGTWSMLDGFRKEQEQMLDCSEDRRRRFLLSYLAAESPTAASILLKTDFVFVLRRLDDKGILDLLKQANGMDDLFKHFCVELLKSTRSDAVWSKSAELLYSCVSEMMPFPFNREIALARFAPKSKTSSVKEAPATQVQKVSRRVHTVQEGENLWKIARSYKVQVDEIVALNGLEKDKIQPGMMLQIP